MGDIVFCQVQPSQHYYAHFVLSIEQDYYANEEKYWIGNIQGKRNGWCYREHIYGILVEVQVRYKGYLYSRPHPKSIYEKVRDLENDKRWNPAAQRLCEPSSDSPKSSDPEVP